MRPVCEIPGRGFDAPDSSGFPVFEIVSKNGNLIVRIRVVFVLEFFCVCLDAVKIVDFTETGFLVLLCLVPDIIDYFTTVHHDVRLALHIAAVWVAKHDLRVLQNFGTNRAFALLACFCICIPVAVNASIAIYGGTINAQGGDHGAGIGGGTNGDGGNVTINGGTANITMEQGKYAVAGTVTLTEV